MSIAAIIEKYAFEYKGKDASIEYAKVLNEHDFPALTAELETMMREEACKFAEWKGAHGYYTDTPGIFRNFYSHIGTGTWTTAELYEQFKQTKEQ